MIKPDAEPGCVSAHPRTYHLLEVAQSSRREPAETTHGSPPYVPYPRGAPIGRLTARSAFDNSETSYRTRHAYATCSAIA